jgi:hypothetical protein
MSPVTFEIPWTAGLPDWTRDIYNETGLLSLSRPVWHDGSLCFAWANTIEWKHRKMCKRRGNVISFGCWARIGRPARAPEVIRPFEDVIQDDNGQADPGEVHLNSTPMGLMFSWLTQDNPCGRSHDDPINSVVTKVLKANGKIAHVGHVCGDITPLGFSTERFKKGIWIENWDGHASLGLYVGTAPSHMTRWAHKKSRYYSIENFTQLMPTLFSSGDALFAHYCKSMEPEERHMADFIPCFAQVDGRMPVEKKPCDRLHTVGLDWGKDGLGYLVKTAAHPSKRIPIQPGTVITLLLTKHLFPRKKHLSYSLWGNRHLVLVQWRKGTSVFKIRMISKAQWPKKDTSHLYYFDDEYVDGPCDLYK